MNWVSQPSVLEAAGLFPLTVVLRTQTFDSIQADERNHNQFSRAAGDGYEAQRAVA